MHSSSYVCGFSIEEYFFFLPTVTSFNEASEDSVALILSCVPLHLPYKGKCKNMVAYGD